MSDMHMVDNEEQRDDRKLQAGEAPAPGMRQLPNRKQRRLIAKRRGVFKHKGAWPYINQRSTNETQRHLNGDHNHEAQN